MATKPRAPKAPIPAPATKRAATNSAKSTATGATAKTAAAKSAPKTVGKPAAKPAAKAAVKAAPKAAVNAKPVAKAPARPVAKPAARRAAPAVPVALKRAAKAVVASAQSAVGNPALVRDSFTMPEAEYAVFASAKQRCLQAGVEIKKSELLRIGMALVGQLDVATLQSVLASLPQLKTGRPRSEQTSL
jgi:hypothetical protein